MTLAPASPLTSTTGQPSGFPLERFVSETTGRDDVEAAFRKMHKGDVLHSIVLFT